MRPYFVMTVFWHINSDKHLMFTQIIWTYFCLHEFYSCTPKKKEENHNLNYTKKNYDIKWPIFKHYNVFSLRQIHKLNPSVESCHDPPAQIKFPSARSFLKWGINWNNMKNVESQRKKKISSEKKNTLPRCKATMRENEWEWSMCTISAVANDRRSHKKRTKNEL